MKTVFNELNESISWLHLRHLNPLPKALESLFSTYKNVLVFELNSGQLCELLRANYLVDARSIHQCNGKPFSTEFIVDNIKKYIL